ncbi:MAG: hypothetical protein IPQ15_09625 [Betaproteobacteria bacterium]|nr:hypothetical protein [Betaproteobacteria bacterium]
MPCFKLFVAGNHKVVIRGTDEGIWRRIHLVPFEVTIAQEARDPNLFDKLKAELPGIPELGHRWPPRLAGARSLPAGRGDSAVADYRQRWTCWGCGWPTAVSSTLP